MDYSKQICRKEPKMDRQQKRRQFQELLLLLNEDPDWHLKPDTERYKKITEFGKEFFKKEKYPGIDRIDEEKYFILRKHGYRVDQIAKEFHVSKNTLYFWRKERGYTNKRNQGVVNQ